MKILVQCPEGLKQKAVEIAKAEEAKGHEVFLSASACYGACDLALDEARWIGADKLIHVGHNRFVSNKTIVGLDVEYIDYKMDVKVEMLVSVLPLISMYEWIALGTTVQHIHQFDEMKAFFERNGKKVFADRGTRAQAVGQVLGCDAGAISKVASEVQAVVFVGDGLFHVTAIDSVDPSKPVFVFNPGNGTVRDIRGEVDRLRKRRKGAIAAAYTAKRFGILLSTKPGQFGLEQARWAKKELEKRGCEAAILVANELEPLSIKNFLTFDCFVNTACPRMADDNEEYGKPILNVGMLNEVFSLIDSSG